MPFNRTHPAEQGERFIDRAPTNRTISPGGEPLEGAPGRHADDEVEGQMGPDELSEPEEVVMNLEAKHHP